jgi:hypothetical protein
VAALQTRDPARTAGTTARRVPFGTRPVSPALVGALAAGVLVCAAAAWGGWLSARGVRLHLAGGVPLAGPWDPRLPVEAVAAVAAVVVGAALVWWLPAWAEHLPWHRLLAASGLAAAAWAVALAATDGVGALAAPLTEPHEYLADVDRVGDASTFLATFTDHVLPGSSGFTWTTHVGGHPPGVLGVFALLDRVGLGGAGPAAALCVAAGASATPAVVATGGPPAGPRRAEPPRSSRSHPRRCGSRPRPTRCSSA